MAVTNEVAIITGASSGIGWELAKVLARKYKVGLVARRLDRLEALAGEIRHAGGTAAIAAASVSDRERTLSAIHNLREQLGPVDLLVANAGVGTSTDLQPHNLDNIEETIKVNLLGVIYTIAAVLPEMLQRGRGHIAAVSSLAAYKGLPGESSYCASKAGVNSYMEGLRVQLRSRGITVTTICPGFIHTPMTAANGFKHMPWAMNADEAARRIARALERRYKVFNFPWQTTLLIRATRWLPDWVLAYFLKEYKKETGNTAV